MFGEILSFPERLLKIKLSLVNHVNKKEEDKVVGTYSQQGFRKGVSVIDKFS